MTERWLPQSAHLIPQQAELVFRGVIFDTYQWPQTLFDGSTATFEMLRRADTVVVIGIDDDGNVITENEHQPNGVVRMGGVAAGGVEPEDASVLDAAKREMREETGYAFRNWRLLEVRQPEMKIEWFVHVFVATGVIDVVEQNLDAGEQIEVQLEPYADYFAHTPYGHRKALSRFDGVDELRAWVGEGEHVTGE
ncbi:MULTISPECIES: NUDIX hydrolase [unclassified Pseudoclavibacter]|uniref:NUDIX hydrolase n=1 Tax=unclassified Pseudoclavibacter TaxID=2615177 RepID=UPI0013010143|nr:MULTISPECIES: NUDIX domain-containing protein [unclassified Pseudoclavibacter]KAB1645657.1 NUDIX domain-containing protein [Pseudoclavibacter sp. CFCC 14310]KAB1658603.1 NUDIX domain-containing protein [Pseudoclavibacter sp. CFCC 11306]KAB1664436.1 NUDIX domain-containing protein [Pseudoclavibacter sp. CFCC 13611]